MLFSAPRFRAGWSNCMVDAIDMPRVDCMLVVSWNVVSPRLHSVLAGARTGQEGGRHMGRCCVLSATMSFCNG